MVEIGVEDARAGPAQAMAREARREGVLAHGGAGQTGLAMDPPQGLSFGPAALHLVVKGFPTASGRGSAERLGWCTEVGSRAPGGWR